MRKMREFLQEELRKRELADAQQQTPGMTSEVVPSFASTAQCNFVPVFPIEIPAISAEPETEEEEEERQLRVYAHRDWRVQTHNREGLYEALRDQLQRTEQRIGLERAKGASRELRESAEREVKQQRGAKKALAAAMQQEGQSYWELHSSGQHCKHLDCISSGLSEENYMRISDARSAEEGTERIGGGKSRVIVNLYGSRLLEETLSGAQVITPAGEQRSSQYVRIGDILPSVGSGPRQTASTKIAISSLSSSSRESRLGSQSKYSRAEHQQDYVIEDEEDEEPSEEEGRHSS